MIPILCPNQTQTYSTNVLHTELIRTGTESKGSCFFYAIAMPYKHFRDLDDYQKGEYIQDLRSKAADSIDIEKWFSIQKGNMAFLQIISTMREMIHSMPSILGDSENKNFLKKYNVDNTAMEILFTLLDSEVIENDIIPEWDVECSRSPKSTQFFLDHIKNKWFEINKKKIRQCIEDLESKIDPHIPRMELDKKSKVVQKLSFLSYPIFEFVITKALSDFKDSIKDYDQWMDVFTFLSIIDLLPLKANIILIDSESGLPYDGMKLLYDKTKFDNDLPFIVLLYFKGLHFESLGKKILKNNKTIINRLFSRSDPFIITCLNYLDLDNEDEAD